MMGYMRLTMKKAFVRVLEGTHVDVPSVPDSIPDWCTVCGFCDLIFFAFLPGERKLSVARPRGSDTGAVDGLNDVKIWCTEAYQRLAFQQ